VFKRPKKPSIHAGYSPVRSTADPRLKLDILFGKTLKNIVVICVHYGVWGMRGDPLPAWGGGGIGVGIPLELAKGGASQAYI
jgi:hypothetical protein